MKTRSNPTQDSPIIVSGLGRSGTTWMQWFLSRHPRIHVHGQSPNLPWPRFWSWYRTLLRQGRWAAQANRHTGYRCAHYAGSDPRRCRELFREMFQRFMTGYGPERPRWGLKWIGMAAEPKTVDQWERFWPDTRWVICIRHPFRTIASAKNTFVPKLDERACAECWVQTCRFLQSHDPRRVAVVAMDKLQGEPAARRRDVIHRVLAVVGEKPCAETDDFLRRWPIVHKVKPDSRRKFALPDESKQMLMDEVPGLAASMKAMGYAADAE